MKTVRLLPVVIFAAVALLLFKGVGLITNGGYVLTGPNAVLAAGEGSDPAAAGATSDDVVLSDLSPTLGDLAPTMATRSDQSSSAAHSSAETDHSAVSGEAPAASSEPASTETATVACPPVPAHQANPQEGTPSTGCAPTEIPVNENGDALPLVQDSSGNFVPLNVAEGDNSEAALLARLADRRVELDRREADIAMRTALLEAAEKRIDERAATLAALEAQVAALVDEKQAAEEAGFKAVVSMYETMKPKEAARIFDTLNTVVLVKVVRAMNPRKMSPILAAMTPDPAQKLTIALAATESTAVVPASGENLANLPQIVGQ